MPSGRAARRTPRRRPPGSRDLKPSGSSRLTLYEIAKLAHVSKSTVSRVLMGKRDVSAKTRARIEQVMRESGYRPSHFARGLAGGRSNLIGVLLPAIFGGYYADVLRGIDMVAHDHRVRIVMSIAHDESESAEFLKDLSTPGQVDGVILVAPSLDLLRETAPDTGVPLVLVSAAAPNSRKGWGRVDSVTLDNEAGVERVLALLAAKGMRRVLHIAGPRTSYDAVRRLDAFREAAGRHPGLEADVLDAARTSRETGERLKALLGSAAKRPDAVFAYNDDTAIAVVKALRSISLRVPEDVSVVGCDDEHASELMGLTTLHVPMVELGQEAARLVFERITGSGASVAARRSALDLPLVERATTKPRK